MAAERPVENSAMPPRHLNRDLFPELLVERTEIVTGGAPPDGIPSIDEPEFLRAGDVSDLDPTEAVMLLQHGSAVRIYPVRIMIWHEIVNDVVDGTPIAVTFCPLCNSGIAFERVVDGQVLDFGTSGYLYRSSLVMYDRQTESLWTHFDGQAVVGTMMGSELGFLAVSTVSWAQASEAHPDALVLQGSSNAPKPYGRNPYSGYDQNDAPLSGFFTLEIPEPVPPMTRVLGVRTSDGQVAIPASTLAEQAVIEAELADLEFVAFWAPGTSSPLQGDEITAGDEIGSTGVFDRRLDDRLLSFESVSNRFVDIETGSTWNILGQAINGPLTGSELRPLEHLDTFWFAWVSYHPDTDLLDDR